ncbi:hypothetical protein Tco_0277608 [Tanacetum coccineum]
MDDPNITMEEYIRLKEEKARRHGKVYNWETATYENDNDTVNMPSFPSPEHTVSYFNDFDFLKDFEKEFPAIAYNDALTSKLDFLTDPTDNDDDKVDIEHSSEDLSVKPLPDVINTDVGAYAHGSNKLLETRPRERNINKYWWRIYKSGNLEVLES